MQPAVDGRHWKFVRSLPNSSPRWPQAAAHRAFITMLVGIVLFATRAVFQAFAQSPQAAAKSTGAILDTVQIASGPVTGSERDGVREYLGIPFAAPPMGELRWKPPVPPQPWTAPRAMTKFSPACPQKNAGINRETVEMGEMSEDCLYLNVWTPAKTRADKLPVMFWIHGRGRLFHICGLRTIPFSDTMALCFDKARKGARQWQG